MIKNLWRGLKRGYYQHCIDSLNRELEAAGERRRKEKSKLLDAQEERDRLEELVKEL